MFSLIISIISIALVASLALASIYYGGAAFNKGTTDADASTIINQGQQIQAAVTLSDVDRVVIANLQGLVTGEYLQEVPQFGGENWADPVSGYSLLSGTVSADVCASLNEKAGHDSAATAGSEAGVFGCNDADVAYYRVGDFYSVTP